MNSLKILLQGFLLICFALFIRFATKRVVLKKRPHIKPIYSSIAYLLVVILFLGFYLFNFPHLLSNTHQKVVLEKSNSRLACQASKNESVKRWEWENQQGKSLHHEYSKSFGLSALVTSMANVILFGMGTMSTVAPFIAQLIVAFTSKYFSKSGKIGQIFPLHHQALSLPVVFAVTISSIAIFFTFHLEADQDRTHLCLLFSGHWFTYFYVTLMGILVLVHFAESKGLYSTYTATYAAYFAICQGLFLRILGVTQQFFHDSEEARGGIYRALVYSPLVFGLFLVVEWFNWNKYVKKQREMKEGRKEVDKLPDDFKLMLKNAGVTKTQLLDEEVMTGIQSTFEKFAESNNFPPPPPPNNIQSRSETGVTLPLPPQVTDKLPLPLPSKTETDLPPPLVSTVVKPTATSLVDAMSRLKKVEKTSPTTKKRNWNFVLNAS
eukprot:TRINITY_DN4876_c0_g1_i2.p1 TRINITY_DN4876_c0_g1~~TRINITY_DN4876_c0_g1_i2.p1  ORF type:complete len:436 (+),score=90.98 TRINITY_DN4876_c0_g1_i2:141-1448(+)